MKRPQEKKWQVIPLHYNGLHGLLPENQKSSFSSVTTESRLDDNKRVLQCFYTRRPITWTLLQNKAKVRELNSQ